MYSEVTPEDKALDVFCDELDQYLLAVMEEEYCDFDTAVIIAQGEYDEYWRVLLESAENGELD